MTSTAITVEKDNGQTRGHYRYYPRLGRRVSKTRQQMLDGQPVGKLVTTRFVWEGYRLL